MFKKNKDKSISNKDIDLYANFEIYETDYGITLLIRGFGYNEALKGHKNQNSLIKPWYCEDFLLPSSFKNKFFLYPNFIFATDKNGKELKDENGYCVIRWYNKILMKLTSFIPASIRRCIELKWNQAICKHYHAHNFYYVLEDLTKKADELAKKGNNSNLNLRELALIKDFAGKKFIQCIYCKKTWIKGEEPDDLNHWEWINKKLKAVPGKSITKLVPRPKND